MSPSVPGGSIALTTRKQHPLDGWYAHFLPFIGQGS